MPTVQRFHRFIWLAVASVLPCATNRVAAVDYLRDVRPILAGKCFQCHGADDAVRQAGLRLDNPASATAALESGQRAIVPGKPEQSALVARITATDAEVAMPPAETGKRLTAAEIETLRQWIAAGGTYSKHWAYVKPVRPPLPTVGDAAWPRGAIDQFVLGKAWRAKGSRLLRLPIGRPCCAASRST